MPDGQPPHANDAEGALLFPTLSAQNAERMGHPAEN
jgi:hypothetical protein